MTIITKMTMQADHKNSSKKQCQNDQEKTWHPDQEPFSQTKSGFSEKCGAYQRELLNVTSDIFDKNTQLRVGLPYMPTVYQVLC